MDIHYETQPLPTKLGYYAHHQPRWFSKLSFFGVYFFEVFVPLLIFFPLPVRVVACFLTIFFQLLIIATGNYAFFNLLTIVLCIPLLPDQFFTWAEPFISFYPQASAHPALWMVGTCVAAILLIFNVIELIKLFVPTPLIRRLNLLVNRYHLVNPYGLFVNMTTVRNEIIIEGSDDGVEWKAYEFRWKPGNTKRAPAIVAPHQPRVDWQMWFAALSRPQRNPWLIRLQLKLLEGADDVVKLLKTNPFPDASPKYMRTTYFSYKFTDLRTKRETGQWWKRESLGNYGPTLSIDS